VTLHPPIFGPFSVSLKLNVLDGRHSTPPIFGPFSVSLKLNVLDGRNSYLTPTQNFTPTWFRNRGYLKMAFFFQWQALTTFNGKTHGHRQTV